jgi:hypothetical protein
MATIILTKSNGTTDITYSPQQSSGVGQASFQYSNQAAGLVAPETLRIGHNLRPQGAKGTDRHSIVLSKAIIETATTNYLVGSVSVQINVPRSSDFTLAMVKDLVAQMTSYLNLTANVTALYNGATPEGDFNVTGPFNPSIA